MKNLRLLVIALTLASACTACPPAGQPVDPVPPRPTPIPTDVEMCDLAEKHLLELGCPEGRPTKRGTPFSMVCRELSAAGIFANPKCLANVRSCAEVDVCTGTVNPSKELDGR